MKKTVGHYNLLLDEKFKEGTLGKSFKAVHQFNGQTIVMRVIPKNKYEGIQAKHIKQNFKNQIIYYSKIQGQNIAKFIDILQSGHNYYVLRQYCSNGTLKDRLNKKQCIKEEEVIKYLVQILKGMFQLVKKGIIHKNLVPQNILFNNQTIKLSDFGIQKINTEIFNQSIRTYSPYKSPQVLNGAKGNFKCDIWALGIMIYQMIYARHPWTSSNQNQLRANIFREKLQFPKQIEISKKLKKFILSCLMVDVNQRAQWTQIFDSILLEQFNMPKLNNLNQKFASILSMLKSNIISSNLDVQRYFKSKNLLSQDNFNRQEFTKLIQPMAPQFTSQQIQFLYVSLDTNGDDQIQLKQFVQAMKQYQIPLQGSYRRKAQKLLRAKDNDKQVQQQQKRQMELQFIYQGIIQNLEKKQIFDLYDLFTQSDKKKLGSLNFDQFVLMLRKIDKTLTKTQCQKLFKQFDKNQDQRISFQQFLTVMSKITGSLNGLIA